MIMNEIKTLRLAAVQMESGNQMTAANLSRAQRLVGQAVAQGAQLVLLPELFSTGFEFTEHAWSNAEPQGGPTEQWLCETARGFGIHLGGSYMEAQEKDFVNTFALATPEGAIAGRVRKRNPCAMEAYLFKGQAGSHAIDTALGRIGIAICYDASLRVVNDDLIAADIDLLLFPVSAPSPVKSWFYPQAKIDAFHAVFREGARHIAAGMGVPVALANKWGPWESAFVGPWPAQRSHFPGFSHISDSEGRELARVEGGEGLAIAEIRLDPARKTRRIPPEADHWRPWVTRVPVEYRLFPLIEALGRRWYRRNTRRPAIAASRHALAHPLDPLPMRRFGGRRRITEIPADPAITALLPGFGFADSYRFAVNGAAIDAPAVTAALFRSEPAWVKALMIVRNRVVQALGLRPVRSGEFPVLLESPDLVVLGLDDKHLDFRIAIRVDRCEDDLQQVTLGTIVRPHNLLGRVYLGAVLPFHRRIVKTTIGRAMLPR